MTYCLPLRVTESLSGFQLTDANGLVIASAESRPWHGTSTEQSPEFVRESFRRLAAAANAESQISRSLGAREAIEKAIQDKAPGYDAGAVAGRVLADIAAAGLMIVNRTEFVRQASL